MTSLGGKAERKKKVKRKENENNGNWGEGYLTLIIFIKSICCD